VKLPRIKTLNHQIDVIEASTTASEAKLANIEKLLETIAGQLERKIGSPQDGRPLIDRQQPLDIEQRATSTTSSASPSSHALRARPKAG
jgi:hypothetical protein